MNEQLRSVATLGIGSYRSAEAARLIGTSSINVRGWIGGYSYKKGNEERPVPPLWKPQLPNKANEPIEIGFLDLIQLRFVKAFIDAGLGLKAVRNCLDFARTLVDVDYPFATRRFRTDGRTIFLKSLDRSGDEQLLDLKRRQYVLGKVIDRTFKDLDIAADIVTRWRPYRGKDSIVIDPQRAFGQPIAAASGVPTIALADAAAAEGSEEQAARLFEVPVEVVRDAVLFERSSHAS